MRVGRCGRGRMGVMTGPSFKFWKWTAMDWCFAIALALEVSFAVGIVVYTWVTP